MNIISNNCAGAVIYRDILKSPYMNPFIWCSTELLQLIPHFYQLNYANIELYNESFQLDKPWHICIDKCVDNIYWHAKFDPSCNNPQVKGVDVYYEKIWAYLTDNYFRRVKRMIELGMPPIYVLYIMNTEHLALIECARFYGVKFITIAPPRLYQNATVCVNEDETLTMKSVLRVCNKYGVQIKRAIQLIAD